MYMRAARDDDELMTVGRSINRNGENGEGCPRPSVRVIPAVTTAGGGGEVNVRVRPMRLRGNHTGARRQPLHCAGLFAFWALFSFEKRKLFETVALSFVFGKYYPTMD